MLADRSRRRSDARPHPLAGRPSLRTRLVLDQMADAIAFLEICGHPPAEAARIAEEIMVRKVNEAYGYREPEFEPPAPERKDVPTKDLTVGLLPRIEDVESAIEVNGRERKRLFTIRRLVLESSGEDPPSRPSAGEPRPMIGKGEFFEPSAASGGPRPIIGKGEFFTPSPAASKAEPAGPTGSTREAAARPR